MRLHNPLGLVAALAFACVAVALPPEIEAAQHAMVALEERVYLLLRVAGIAWIAIEWCAVLFLWQAYRFLAREVARWEARKP